MCAGNELTNVYLSVEYLLPLTSSTYPKFPVLLPSAACGDHFFATLRDSTSIKFLPKRKRERLDRCGSGVYSGLVVCIRDQSRRTSSDTHRNLCTFSPNVAPTLGSLWCDKYSDDLKPVAVAAWNRLRSLTNAVCSTSQRQRPGSCESVVCSRRAGCCRRMKALMQSNGFHSTSSVQV